MFRYTLMKQTTNPIVKTLIKVQFEVKRDYWRILWSQDSFIRGKQRFTAGRADAVLRTRPSNRWKKKFKHILRNNLKFWKYCQSTLYSHNATVSDICLQSQCITWWHSDISKSTLLSISAYVQNIQRDQNIVSQRPTVCAKIERQKTTETKQDRRIRINTGDWKVLEI